MRRRSLFLLLLAMACQADRAPEQNTELSTTAEGEAPSDYVYVWAGDSAGVASDFLAVLDASPSSGEYGMIVSATPTGKAGTHPHHTESMLGDNRHLLANGFATGETWLYDLTDARQPRILASFADVGGFSHPHTFVRLSNGNVLATFQYAAGSKVGGGHMHGSTSPAHATPLQRTGGLVEMDERGTLVQSGSAVDTTITDRFIYPYAVLPIALLDRALSTTTDMDATNEQATATYVQLWRLSDLTLLQSVALPPGPRGDEHQYTGEMHLLPNGTSALVHTFSCGLYLVDQLDGNTPTASFVHRFEGQDCGVPVLAGHYWLQPVPQAHALVALDVRDPAKPKEVSRVTFGDDEEPHWIALEPSGKRLLLNSGGAGSSNRIFLVHFDPATGALSIDERFRDAGAARAGVRFSARTFPQGFTGTAIPHGSVFSR